MPTYEYWCPKCKEKFSVTFKKVQHRHTDICPKCKGECGLVMSPTWHRNVFKNKSEIGA